MTKREYCLSHDHIAYYSGVGGIEIHGIENDHRTFNSYSRKFMFQQLLRYYKKGLNNWIELYNSDNFKSKREKNRMNYYINKLNEFERLLND